MQTSFERELEKHVKDEKPAALIKSIAPLISKLSMFMLFGALYYLGMWMLIKGKIDGKHIGPESWGIYIDAFTSMFLPIFSIMMIAQGFGMLGFATDLSKAGDAAHVAFGVLNQQPAIASKSNGKLSESKECKGAITFESVAFTYPNRLETPIYENLSMVLEAGKTTALVGSSGSGKSTAVQLIERFYDPLKGRVLLDGVDLKDLDLVWLRRQIGLVGQEPVLFGGTIIENIQMGKESATRDEAIAAAKMANAHNFIEEFQDGYDTDVGGGGDQLSGGQKQRVAIARAIVKDPSILLLDEATSALDNESERVVQAALDELVSKRTRTTVVIAHRLTTIRDADKIIVLDKGNAIEEGTHQQLIEKQGAYFALQARMH